MKTSSSLSTFILLLILILISSDCKKQEQDNPYEVHRPCTYAYTVWIGMNIIAQYPLNEAFITDISPTIKWIHDGQGLYSGKFGCKYDIYLGTLPEHLEVIATDRTSDTLTLNGLTFNQKYYWKVMAKYGWVDEGVQCNNISETKIMSFTPY
jgi:hypothetical protein